MKWSEDNTIKFVELYREYECLWDVTKQNYRNNQMRVGALEKIIEEMGVEGFTVAEARQKIKSLRNTYTQELQKIDKSIKSGMGSNDVYTPTLKWFHIMDNFMRKTKEKRQSQSNLESSTDQIQENIQIQSEQEHGTIEETRNIEVSKSKRTNPSKAALLLTSRSSMTGQKRRYHELSTAVTELHQMNQVLQKPFIEEDEFDAFGRYMALGLKKLRTHLAIQCQNDLQNSLTRYRSMAISAPVLEIHPSSSSCSYSSNPCNSPQYSTAQSSQTPATTSNPQLEDRNFTELYSALTNTFTEN